MMTTSEGKKCVGIIGGMGPLATCDLMMKLTRYTRAASDQEHIHVLIDSNTNIPDRTKAILGTGEDPLPEMRKSARLLESMGAGLLIMPCNTAHYYHQQIQESVGIPLLHMPAETARVLKEQGISSAGILATEGTRRAGIYQMALEAENISPVYPDAEDQRLLMQIIYDYVKAGKDGLEKLPVREMTRRMHEAGAQILILGCTELPIAFERLGLMQMTVDPTVVLAKAAIRAAGYEVREV